VDDDPARPRPSRFLRARARRIAVATAAVAVLVLAQLAPVTVRDNPPISAEMPAPAAVRTILRRACYDCHSNETRWPWYSGVAPASWLLARDVRDARMRMNFSTWPQSAPPGMDCHFRRRIAERVAGLEMPPFRYRLLHPGSEVQPEEVARLEAWAEGCGPEG